MPRSLRDVALGACAFLYATAGPALAENALIEDVWQAFEEHCGPVMRTKGVDPDAFDNLPSEHRISKSTDGRRIQVDHQTQDMKWSVSAAQSDLAATRYIYCMVGYHNLQPLEDFDGIVAALRERLEKSNASDIAGGEDEFLRITPLYATPGSGLDQTVHMDAIGVLSEPDFVAQFQVYSYGISIGTLAVLPLREVQ
ncbi:hypothetical protein K1T73_16830 [Roseovarius sp. SCSIO 43702]|uniref:hypothetical protein n=1 Tax=Roseovarius sp. SCSIO 43702 TaxID=2823043 RepID=UPI001C73C2A4|nr:hypothetical protein [Roseovarius sp. SCSIO 43702]QYX56676.1 hypothetical protein K1T73_16830 [Roseovarius sp. SCSIO 43702]